MSRCSSTVSIVTSGPESWVHLMELTLSPAASTGQARTEVSVAGRTEWSARTLMKLAAERAATSISVLEEAVRRR